MPILGKRKYINDRIEKLINKLDTLGYDTEHIKRRFYDYNNQQSDQEETNDYSESSGSILPYRNKINDVLKMIEEVIKFNSNSNITTPEQFKNDLIEEVKERQNYKNITKPNQYYNQNNTRQEQQTNKSFSLGYY